MRLLLLRGSGLEQEELEADEQRVELAAGVMYLQQTCWDEVQLTEL